MRKYSPAIYLSIFLFSFLYLFIFQNYGINLWDEGVLLNGSLRTLEGESVYTDFNGYPPGRYLLGAALFKIFGINISVIRIAVAVMTAVAVAMLYSISLRVIPASFLAIIPSILFLVSPAVYYNRFYPIFTIFSIYVTCWYLIPTSPPIQKRGMKGVVLALSVILSLLFKLEIGMGIMIVSMTMMLFRGKFREFKYFIFTLVLTTLFLTFYYLRGIDIYSFLYDVYFHVFKIYNSWGNPFPSLFSLNLWKNFNTHEIFSVLLFYIPLIIYLLIFIILLRTPTLRQAQGELRTSLAVILFFGIYTYNLVIWRTGFDNLIRCLPPALILGSYLLYLFRIKLLEWTGERRFSYAIILILPLWFLYEMVFYGDFYAGSIGEMKKTHAPLLIERAANIYTDPVEASWIKEITVHIKNNTKSEDTIFAIPLNSIWYFLTDRKNPTYYEWILPGTLKNGKEEMAVIEQLKKRMPVFVIYADIAIDNKEERRFSNYAPLVYNFIIDKYHVEKTVGFYQIWRYGK
ncbi:MAG: hypothetical protein HY096_13465 [Nitrospinae bacterium]|nr:hypothetical protein [Nitrospinota bacterium]